MAALHLSVWHIIILLATVALVIGTGFYVGRSVRSADSYSLNGRSAGPWLVAGSIAGTVVGGGSTVGTAQFAFSFGGLPWVPAWPFVSWGFFTPSVCGVRI